MRSSVLNPAAAGILLDRTVRYPENFNAPARYPEYPFDQLSKRNDVYAQVRNLLYTMGLDRERFGKASWNPLGCLIQPGQTVLIKPNLVRHFNPSEPGLDALVTHGSVIRAIADYCCIALKGKGRLIVADAPLQSAVFSDIAAYTKLNELVSLYKTSKQFAVELIDLRKKTCSVQDSTRKADAEGDPRGYTIVDLGADSCHAGRSIDFTRYRVTDYAPSLMRQCHNAHSHKYLISNTVLSADVVINLPKLKTHRKAGFTGALKNLIGINCLKDYLPHHAKGSVPEGGDEYRRRYFLTRLQSNLLDIRNSLVPNSLIKQVLETGMRVNDIALRLTGKKEYFEGSWYGNDTIWRTVLDLNRILVHTDKNGTLRAAAQRKLFILVDAIVAGEREGPLEPSAKACGALIAGFNPATVDVACANFMGFDPSIIPQVTKAFQISRYPIVNHSMQDVKMILNGRPVQADQIRSLLIPFIPSEGWKPVLNAGLPGNRGRSYNE